MPPNVFIENYIIYFHKNLQCNVWFLIFFLVKAFHSGINGSQYVWLWLETYQANWWSEGDKMKDDMIKAVIQYSISFGDNLNVQDNTTTTVGGRVSKT